MPGFGEEKYKVAITTPIVGPPDIEQEILRDIAVVYVSNKVITSEEEVLSFAKDAHALMLSDTEPITDYVMDNMPNLRIVVRYGIGVDTIDVEAATERGVLVANVPDYCIEEVADHAATLILALMRQIVKMNELVKSGEWRSEITEKIGPIHEYRVQTLGFLGFGKIARRVALRIRPFGFNMITYDPYVPRWDCRLLGVEPVNTLDELLKKSDIISIHTLLIPETRHLIGAGEIEKMKPTAYIVNVSRGGIIDQGALYEALKEGRIAGAALDVLDPEPPSPNDPILQLDNVILTPHIAYYSEESIERCKVEAAKAVAKALRGERPDFLINPEALRTRKNQ